MSGLIERLFERMYHIEPLVPDAADIALRLAFRVYRGPGFRLSDGTQVRRGDRVVELHLSNERVARLHRDHDDIRRIGLAYAVLLMHSLRALADAWPSEARFEDVVAAYGVSIFPEQAGPGRFEVRELCPAWRRRLLSWWIRRVVAHAHPQGSGRVIARDGTPREVTELWMSRAQCLANWGKESGTHKHLGESRGRET